MSGLLISFRVVVLGTALLALTACSWDRNHSATVTAADTDHNGIRDDVDALIAGDPSFYESPEQTTAAVVLARIFERQARMQNPTKAKAVRIAHETTDDISCFKSRSSYVHSHSGVEKLLKATYNTPQRRENDERFNVLVSGEAFEFRGLKGCKPSSASTP